MRVKNLQCWSVLVPFGFKGTRQLSFHPFDGVVFLLGFNGMREECNKAANKDVPLWCEWSSLLPFPFLFCQLLSRSGVIHGTTVADKEMLQLPCKSFKRLRWDYSWRGKPGCSEILSHSGIRKWGLDFTKETQRLVKRNIEPVQRAISPLNYGLWLPLFTPRLSNATPVCEREPTSQQFIFPLVRKQLKVSSWAKARVIVGWSIIALIEWQGFYAIDKALLISGVVHIFHGQLPALFW